MRSPVSGGTGRDLLVLLGATTAVAVSGVGAMAVAASGAVVDPSALVLLGAAAGTLGVPGIVHRRRTRQRRILQRRVGDPSALSGRWRRALAAAWIERDRYAAAAASDGTSPLSDRLAEHQVVVDAALERCGLLAREGELLDSQLRSFGVRRLQRDLRAARRRGGSRNRARQLEERLAEADHLRRYVQQVRERLDAQVHDMRTAAWRATELRTRPVVDADDGLGGLLEDLRHLAEALDEVDPPPQPVADVDTPHDVGQSPASAGGLRYDV